MIEVDRIKIEEEAEIFNTIFTAIDEVMNTSKNIKNEKDDENDDEKMIKEDRIEVDKEQELINAIFTIASTPATNPIFDLGFIGSLTGFEIDNKKIKNEKDDEKMYQEKSIRYEFYESLTSYFLVANVAGFTRNDIDIVYKNFTLYIKLKNNDKFEESKNCFTYNIEKVSEDLDMKESSKYGIDIDGAEIILDISEKIDSANIKATVNNGLLEVLILKLDQPTKIEVK